MGEEDVLIVVAIPVLLQHGRYFVGGETLGEKLRMLDVVIIGNTSVLRHLLVVGAEKEVRLIAVAQIRSPHRIFEVRRALCIVVAATVFVVESESATQLLVGIHRKDCLEVILTVGSVTAAIQRDVGDRRVGVGEVEVAHGGDDIIVWFREHKVALRIAAVDEDTVDAGGTHVAQGVVLSAQSFREGGILVHCLHGVDHSSPGISKSLIHSPYPDSLRNFLVSAQRVGVDAVAGLWAEL